MKKIVLTAILVIGAGVATSQAGGYFEFSVGSSVASCGPAYSTGWGQPAYTAPYGGSYYGYTQPAYAYTYPDPYYGYRAHRQVHRELQGEHRDLHQDLTGQHWAEHRQLDHEAAIGVPWWALEAQHRAEHRELNGQHWQGHEQLRDEHHDAHHELQW